MCYERVEEFFREHPGLRRLDVRYEDFIAGPEAHVRRIASSIGLEPGEERIRRATAFVLSPGRGRG
ncbi:sulfotransferase [Pyrodictium occultum]|uniref:sulfotransferase n=1 Tax=Pyrodictium occultum TaxID=2309 RepID=UPI003B83193C